MAFTFTASAMPAKEGRHTLRVNHRRGQLHMAQGSAHGAEAKKTSLGVKIKLFVPALRLSLMQFSEFWVEISELK